MHKIEKHALDSNVVVYRYLFIMFIAAILAISMYDIVGFIFDNIVAHLFWWFTAMVLLVKGVYLLTIQVLLR